MLRPGRGNGDNLPTYGGGSASVGYGGVSEASYGGYNSNGNSTYGNGGSSFREKRRSPRKHGSFDFDSLKNPTIWSYVCALVCFCAMLSYRSGQNQLISALDRRKFNDALVEIMSMQKQRDHLQNEVRTHRETQRKLKSTQQEMESSNQKLKQQIADMKQKHEGPERASEKEKIKTREEAWKSQVQVLQQATSRESRRAATEKFGPGPHFVRITVEMENAMPKSQSFTVQMASLDSMPHAVHLFLEQVAHQLWNRGWFYINGPHVMQAGPQADFSSLSEHDDVDERKLALAPFRELQLDTLAFPEYSEDFPHEPYTLGFTGRPGGPDWYINKVDNTEAHGPGGQFHHELEEFADSCFAKVIDGYDVIKTMMNLPTVLDAGDYQYFYEIPVYISNMQIVGDPTKPQEEVPKELEEHLDLTGAELKEALKEAGAATGDSTLIDILHAIKHVKHPDAPETAKKTEAATAETIAGSAKLSKEDIELHMKKQQAANDHVVEP